jgi:N utilization substance protein A
MDPESRQTHVLVAEDQLSLAIGKEGQNVRLAARLTGWKIDIKDQAKYDEEAENTKFAAVRAQYQSQNHENHRSNREDEIQEELELDEDRFDNREED